ncbi:hypothetical protein [Endozoicomonas elysicola]|uniref:hypothetical protein n=1 Tax=Endozoicomonas elysicola TaxID=305900 RepID=UPI0012688DEB|nr:hypothetical protein [Endozoicomonas elysicola]
MTETQYLLGWAAYLTGAIGCLLSLWFIIRKWHPRLKRPLMMIFAVLFFLPGTIYPEQDFLGPAFLVSLFDGLSLGVDAMWRSGQAVALTAGVAAMVGLLLPVSKTKASNGKKKTQKTKRNDSSQRQRKEPTC